VRPLGRPRRRWEDNIIMDLRELVWDNADWIDAGGGRGHCRCPVNTTVNFPIAEKGGEISDQLSDYFLKKDSDPWM